MNKPERRGNLIDITPVVSPGVNSLEIATRYADDWAARMLEHEMEDRKPPAQEATTGVERILDIDPCRVVYGGLRVATVVVGAGVIYKIGDIIF